jgi:pimeloyl-ACP methyl ester carboxylesterase
MATCNTLPVRGAKLFYKVRGTGPALLVLQGGGGNADASDGLASELDATFTTISYDRRGLLRSPLDDPRQALSIEQHADDAHALIEHVAPGPVFVFGSSLGALIGLEILGRWPDCVTKLVAHEPPATELLSEDGQANYKQLCTEIRDIALSQGPRQALRKQIIGMGIDRDDREGDSEPPMSAREQSQHTSFLLTREARAVERFRVNLNALTRVSGRIVPAYGASSREYYPAECAISLAQALARTAEEFPGGHTGYVLRPRAFALKLSEVFGVTTRASGLVYAGPSDPTQRMGQT